MKNLFKKARQLSKNSNDTGNIDGGMYIYALFNIFILFFI